MVYTNGVHHYFAEQSVCASPPANLQLEGGSCSAKYHSFTVAEHFMFFATAKPSHPAKTLTVFCGQIPSV